MRMKQENYPIQTVLSLDVDYFVQPKVTNPPNWRPVSEGHRVRPLAEVSQFLHNRCLLSVDRRVPGRAAIDHDAAFHALRDWIEAGRLRVPFVLAHVDAHADLGLGDAGYSEILDEIIRRPLERRADNPTHLCPGNWLPYAIANRWICEVQFLREPDPGKDAELMPVYFTRAENFSVLQMQPMDEGQYMKACMFEQRREYADLPTKEPAVQWNQMAEDGFRLQAPPDFVFTCLSPEYTPGSADAIFSLVRSMILEDVPLALDELERHLAGLQMPKED